MFWAKMASGGPHPASTGCFTLSSPATMAEGLCLYNSGYLHWVRKPISHTHTHTHISCNHIIHLRPSYPHTVGETLCYCHWEQLQPHWHILKFSIKRLFWTISATYWSLHGSYWLFIFTFCKHYCAVYYWNADRFYFQRCFRGVQGSQRLKNKAQWIHAAVLIM